MSHASDPHPGSVDVAYLDAHDLMAALDAGSLTTTAVVETLLARIAALDTDDTGPQLRAVISVADNALDVAAAMDVERAAGQLRGPLHGVPVLVKDNIDTVGSLGTTAGSLALVGTGPSADAPLVTRLRDAGALVLGKTNLSEWANIRSKYSSSGWSAVGGQCRNPHALDRSPGGSSSGTGSAIAAGYAPLGIGTETDGSITCPAAVNGLVGLKPTVGSVPGAGIVPISHRQDTAGPMTRSVRDAALLFAVLSGRPVPASVSTTAGTDGTSSLAGLRIGLPRSTMWGNHPASDDAATEAVNALRAAGAEIIDDVELPLLPTDKSYGRILLTDLVHDLAYYLATRSDVSVRTLADVVAFNRDHADTELTHFGQDQFELALEWAGPTSPADSDELYQAALATCVQAAKTDGLDTALREHRLDALVAPAYPPAWKIDLIDGNHGLGSCTSYSAISGYPILTVPVGELRGLPLSFGILGGADSEATLLRLATVVEATFGRASHPAFTPPQVG